MGKIILNLGLITVHHIRKCLYSKRK